MNHPGRVSAESVLQPISSFLGSAGASGFASGGLIDFLLEFPPSSFQNSHRTLVLSNALSALPWTLSMPHSAIPALLVLLQSARTSAPYRGSSPP